MLTAHSFLAAILDEPHEDFHRIIFADWLEDQGEPERAEFIRAQVEAWDGQGDDLEKWNRLYHKANNLLTAKRFLAWMGGPWCKGLQVMVRSSSKVELYDGEDRSLMLTVRRGFLTEVRCDCAAWRDLGPGMVAGQLLERVDLSDVDALKGTSNWTTLHPRACTSFPWNFTSYHKASARRWPSEEALWDALSRDCLNWAREEAGLPLLRDDE